MATKNYAEMWVIIENIRRFEMEIEITTDAGRLELLKTLLEEENRRLRIAKGEGDA